MSGANNRGAFVWSADALKMLEVSYAKGDTMQSIADALARAFKVQISKSAVCGKAFRLKLVRSDTFAPNLRGNAPKASVGVKRARPNITEQDAGRLRRLKDLQRIEADQAAGMASDPLPKAKNSDALALAPKGIMALGHGCCRWPLNVTADDGSVLFCGNDRGSARPYCLGHARIAWKSARTPDQIADEAKTWAENVQRAGVRQGATRHFNTPLAVAS